MENTASAFAIMHVHTCSTHTINLCLLCRHNETSVTFKKLVITYSVFILNLALSMASKKRKIISDGGRIFQERWTEIYICLWKSVASDLLNLQRRSIKCKGV